MWLTKMHEQRCSWPVKRKNNGVSVSALLPCTPLNAGFSKQLRPDFAFFWERVLPNLGRKVKS